MFAPGSVLCRLGDPVDRLIITISGQVNVESPANFDGCDSPTGRACSTPGAPGPAPPLRPACLGAACVLAAHSAASGGFPPLALYGATAVARGRVEVMVVPADRVALVVAQEASPDVPAIKELLRGLPALEWLPDGPLTALAINATLRQYAPGEVIIRQGANADAFAFVVSGAVRLLRALPIPPDLLDERRTQGVVFRAEREQAYQCALKGERLPGAQEGGGGSTPRPGAALRRRGGTAASLEEGRPPQPAAPRDDGGSGAGGRTGALGSPLDEGAAGQRPPVRPGQGAAAAPGGCAMRRPSVPLLCLPPLGPGETAEQTPAFGGGGSGDAAAADGLAGADGAAQQEASGGGAHVEGLAPLVQAIEAAMKWAHKSKKSAAAAAAPSSGNPKTPRGGGVLAAATPRGGPTTARRRAAFPATAAASPLTANAGPWSQDAGAGAASKGVRWSVAAAAAAAGSDPRISPSGGVRAGGSNRRARAPASRRVPEKDSPADDTGDGDGGKGGGVHDDAGGAESGPAEGAWPRVVVQLGRLGPGQCFGDVREGCVKGACGYSAVADAPCDVLAVGRQVVARALGPSLLPLLWEAAPEGRPRGAARPSDAALREQLLGGLEWEARKACMAAARAERRRRARQEVHGGAAWGDG
ncbi:hypothetical protein MNEG_0993 [Monoraphidium neglectum]|uniref:Cyclic nucleotide-binding domain-containing protein n=1 Tax=Monoraphidium neglectum TaxID=145388 RepID=A0A0D2LKN7_9CHLO|nr:hypothetical protein MNEG_0993 [Monoraphidium neglectum]KIZ06964.1 hypothetical protein MNEG_0993 [Monoraphidium neglectum]|eukprot:XP_013905983.1 hypothetical protein MNEG_0993 [Monoraphidium neglectum]